MEKHAHMPENPSKQKIHPTLSVYLTGNFANQPRNQSVNQFNIQSDESEETKSNCFLLFFEKLYKNRVQTSSVTGGYLQLLVSGLHISWGIWRMDFNEPWFTLVNGVFIFIILSFYVGAIVGGVIAGFIVNIWRKQAIYYLSGSILVISSLILIIWCQEEVGILFGRIVAGIGHGLCYSVVVIHAGENAMKEIRGIVTSTINCILWASIFIGSLIIATVQMGYFEAISSNRMIGIFGLAFSVSAMIYTLFWTHESVVFLLNRNKLGEALELLTILRNEETETINIQNDFEEMRLMVNQDKQENKNIFKNNNEKALGLMVNLKMLHVLTNNFLFNWFVMIIFSAVLPVGSRRMSPVVMTGVRFMSSSLQVLLAESAGRKLFLKVFCVLAGVTLLILEIMVISVSTFTNVTNWVASALCVVIQVFVAFGIDPMSHVCLSEAFGTSKKNWSVAFVTIFENAAQMFFIGMCFVEEINIQDMFHVMIFITVTCILSFIIILVLFLPETRGLSLKETRDLYKGITTRCLQH